MDFSVYPGLSAHSENLMNVALALGAFGCFLILFAIILIGMRIEDFLDRRVSRRVRSATSLGLLGLGVYFCISLFFNLPVAVPHWMGLPTVSECGTEVAFADSLSWEASRSFDSALVETEALLSLFAQDSNVTELEISHLLYERALQPTKLEGCRVVETIALHPTETYGSASGGLFYKKIHSVSMPQVKEGQTLVILAEHEGEYVRLVVPSKKAMLQKMKSVISHYAPSSDPSHGEQVLLYHDSLLYQLVQNIGLRMDENLTQLWATLSDPLNEEDSIVVDVVSMMGEEDERTYVVDYLSFDRLAHLPEHLPSESRFLGAAAVDMIEDVCKKHLNN